MKVGLGDFLVRKYQNVINNLNTDMNSFLVGFKLFRDLENPIDQNLSHFQGHFCAIRTFCVKLVNDIDIESVIELLNVGFNLGKVGLYLR